MSGDLSSIKNAVAEHFNISRQALDSASRVRSVAWPRQIAMTIAREITTGSLPAIANSFGRDHTTVLHAVKWVRLRSSRDPNFARAVDTLRLKFKADRESWLDRFKAERLACDAVADFIRSLGQVHGLSEAVEHARWRKTAHYSDLCGGGK